MFQNGKPAMNDEPTREALQFYVDLFYEHRLEDFTFSGNFVFGHHHCRLEQHHHDESGRGPGRKDAGGHVPLSETPRLIFCR